MWKAMEYFNGHEIDKNTNSNIQGEGTFIFTKLYGVTFQKIDYLFKIKRYRFCNISDYVILFAMYLIMLSESRRLRWTGRIARVGERRGEYRVLVGKHEGRRPLGRPRRTWEDNIKMGLREVEWGMDWINLAQDRDRWLALLNTVVNLWIPYNVGNFLSSLQRVSFSRRIMPHGV
jgi:hypothetical protein